MVLGMKLWFIDIAILFLQINFSLRFAFILLSLHLISLFFLFAPSVFSFPSPYYFLVFRELLISMLLLRPFSLLWLALSVIFIAVSMIAPASFSLVFITLVYSSMEGLPFIRVFFFLSQLSFILWSSRNAGGRQINENRWNRVRCVDNSVFRYSQC